LIADYILVYKGTNRCCRSKSDELELAKVLLAAPEKLNLETTYSITVMKFASICMKTGVEGLVDSYLSR
jgi:type I restriction enzyme R subunit